MEMLVEVLFRKREVCNAWTVGISHYAQRKVKISGSQYDSLKYFVLLKGKDAASPLPYPFSSFPPGYMKYRLRAKLFPVAS